MDYTATDGVQTNLGALQIRNVFVAARTKDAPGALQGVVVNSAEDSSKVTFTGTDGTVGTVNVPAGQVVDLHTKSLLIDPVSVWPGQSIPITVTAGEDSADLNVPVLDGSLPEYADLVPTAKPTATT